MNTIYDTAIIGGGPAGMISAIEAGKSGKSVLLIEKNKKLGRKLLITGKGRCNITNDEIDTRKLVEKYGKNGKFLFSCFSRFSPQDIINFFEENKLKLKVERGQRVFPNSDKSADVLKVLGKCLKENKVEVVFESEVADINIKNDKIEKIKFLDRGEIKAENYIFCTGGKSYPATGSDGKIFKLLESAGHKINKLSPSLTPIKIKESWVKDLQGLSLKNVELSIYKNSKKIDSRFGEMLFAHFGITGPIVLDISKQVGELLGSGIYLELDLKPALDEKKLDERLQRDFKKYNNKMFKNALDDLLPQKMVSVILSESGIDENKKVNSISKEERKHLVETLKHLKLTPEKLLGFDHAIITSGGIDLKKVDPKTMKSKILDNLYFAGEILDIDGPTGGYNLQVAWSTGYVAGSSVK